MAEEGTDSFPRLLADDRAIEILPPWAKLSPDFAP